MNAMSEAKKPTGLTRRTMAILDEHGRCSSSLSALGLIGAAKSARAATSQARFTSFTIMKCFHDLTSTVLYPPHRTWSRKFYDLLSAQHSTGVRDFTLGE